MQSVSMCQTVRRELHENVKYAIHQYCLGTLKPEQLSSHERKQAQLLVTLAAGWAKPNVCPINF